MEALARSPLHDSPERVQLLLADGDAHVRSSLAARVRATVEAIVVLEAGDGAEAVQLGLQQRPQIALLDVDMPTLGGIEVALTLREVEPGMRVALQTAHPHAHRDRACAHGLPLFDELERERTLSWLDVQAQSCAESQLRPGLRQKRALECSSCRYGIACARPPLRCPMCQAEDAWIQAPWRPFRGDVRSIS